jgi:hypothetical protein
MGALKRLSQNCLERFVRLGPELQVNADGVARLDAIVAKYLGNDSPSPEPHRRWKQNQNIKGRVPGLTNSPLISALLPSLNASRGKALITCSGYSLVTDCKLSLLASNWCPDVTEAVLGA